MAGRERDPLDGGGGAADVVAAAAGGGGDIGLEFWGESLLLHSLFSGGGLEGDGVLLRSSSKLGDVRPRPFEVCILFVFENWKHSKILFISENFHISTRISWSRS